jgi:hypothetical protein
VELRGAQDAYRDRARQHGPLLRDLRCVVASGEPVDPDDGRHDDLLHAGPLADLLQVAGRGGEEGGRGRLIGRGLRGDVDDAGHARQRFRQTLPGDHIDAAGTRHRDDVTSIGLEHVDDMTADPSGCPSNCDFSRVSA